MAIAQRQTKAKEKLLIFIINYLYGNINKALNIFFVKGITGLRIYTSRKVYI